MLRRTTLLLAFASLLFLSTRSASATSAPPGEELRCLALTIYWEARSESQKDRAAVAHVALNRVGAQGFPDTVCRVVQQGGERPGRCQFHWWCDGRSDEPQERRAWNEAVALARKTIEGEVDDPTNGALYFHNARVRPSWAEKHRRTTRIGSHLYYR